jgi:hypothetical protein
MRRARQQLVRLAKLRPQVQARKALRQEQALTP